ncbi:MAG: hypothetical protein IIU14_04705 [Ruminococcus sp.]|nr:hypothetical protein [Ruminococcus sp.]
MKVFAKTISMLLTLIIAFSAVMIPASVSAAVKYENAEVYLYEYISHEFSASSHSFKLSYSKDGKKYLKAYVDYAGGGDYYVGITGIKATPKDKPVSVRAWYKNKAGEKIYVQKLKVTVKGTKPRFQKFPNIKLNEGTLKVIDHLKYNYTNVEERISDESVVKLDYNSKYTTSDIYTADYTDIGYVKALKKGTATVSYWLKDYNVKVGEFKVTVKNVKTAIQKKYSTVKLNYVEGGKTIPKNSFYTALILKNYHKDAVYTTKFAKPELVKVKTVKKGKVSPNANEKITAVKDGTTKAAIYETMPNGKKTKVGTFYIKIKKKTMAQIVTEQYDADEAPFSTTVQVGEKFDTKDYITCYIPKSFKNYKITYESNNPEILSVDENGIMTAHKENPDYDAQITFTITFSDNSVFQFINAPQVVL